MQDQVSKARGISMTDSVKLLIGYKERWPDYYLTDEDGLTVVEVEVTHEKAEHWIKVQKEYRQMQEEMDEVTTIELNAMT